MLKEELKEVNAGHIHTVHFEDGTVYCPDNAGTFVTIQETRKKKTVLAVWRKEKTPVCLSVWYPEDIKKFGLRKYDEDKVS